MKYFWMILAAWNLIVFALYGLDKYKAIKDKRRIRERTLLLCALLLGAIGAFLGMRVFRHKTKHRLFVIGVPLCILVNLALLYALLIWRGGSLHFWRGSGIFPDARICGILRR